MGQAAIKLAKKIKYCSAGTVEFLFDDKTDEFWFLEVNTRLQVEHPVTEEVTGIDLVAEQIKIARGDELEFAQDDIDWHGHAIEARLYAEDPGNNFLPEIGTLHAYDTSLASEVRWDSGVEEGSVIGTDFDPMLSKVISWAPNRIDAANKLARGLEKAHMGGVVTNRQFLISCLRNESFLNGNTTTDFIEREALETKKNLSVNELHQTSTAIALWLAQQNRVSDPVTGFMPANWTNGRMPLQRVKLLFVQDEIEVKYKLNKDNLYEVMGSICKIYHCDSFGIDIQIDSHRFYAHITEAGSEIVINMPFGDVNASVLPRFIEPGNDIPEGGLIAPMPGKVIDVKVKKGSKVKAGDTLVIIEAMKMEHSIKATETGKIAKVMIQLNDQVDNGATFSFLNNNMKSHAVLSKQSPQLGKRHLEVMDELESMLDKGKSFSTMSDLAKQLKISLRTLYEIAPSKEELIVTTVDRVLKKHGKIAIDAMNAHSSPIKKLESFLTVANQAVGPRFERFTLSLSSLNSSKAMVDYHEQYITDLIKNLLDEARIKNEIKEIDTQATALLLGGLGRYFQSKKLLKDLHQTPEKTSNFLTKIIIDGIKMEKS